MAGMTVEANLIVLQREQSLVGTQHSGSERQRVGRTKTDGPTNKPFRLALPAPARQKFCLA